MKKVILILALLGLGYFAESGYCFSMKKEVKVRLGLIKGAAVILYDFRELYVGTAFSIVDYRRIVQLDLGIVTQDNDIINKGAGVSVNINELASLITGVNLRLPEPLTLGTFLGLDTGKRKLYLYGGVATDF